MIKQNKLLDYVNILYIYLLYSLISISLIILSFGILLVPIAKTLVYSSELISSSKFDYYRGVLKFYFKNLKSNLKYLKYGILSIYFILTTLALNASSSFYILIINIMMMIVTFYFINIIAVILQNYTHDNKLKTIYKLYVTKFSTKQKLDSFMLTSVYMLIILFGYIKVFLILYLVYVTVFSKILKEKKND